uniref:Uncharacterized protein n=1 Tax=Accipiter nisus TaxID=211598 RepID=A0A8B9MXL0_9AVES
MAGVSYSPPWWVSLLHRLPHLSLRWELTAADFRPHDAEYQQVGPRTGSLFLCVCVCGGLCPAWGPLAARPGGVCTPVGRAGQGARRGARPAWDRLMHESSVSIKCMGRCSQKTCVPLFFFLMLLSLYPVLGWLGM